MLPTGPLAAQRATLPQTLRRQVFGTPEKPAAPATSSTTDTTPAAEPAALPDQNLVPEMSFPAVTTP